LNGPQNVQVDTEGDPLVADTHNQEIEVLALAATNPGYSLPAGVSWIQGNVYVLAGGSSGSAPSSSGTTAASTSLDDPFEFLQGALGDFVVVDQGTDLIERLQIAPTAPSISMQSASLNSVSLTWSPPSSDGGSMVENYVVDVFAPGASPPVPSSQSTSTSTTFVVSGLTPGTTYGFEIEAVNAIGTGSPSSEVLATTLAASGSGSTTTTTSPPGAVTTTTTSGAVPTTLPASSSTSTTTTSPASGTKTTTVSSVVPSVRVSVSRLAVKDHTVTFTVSCRTGSCAGTAVITATHQEKEKTKHGTSTIIVTSVLASSHYDSVAPKSTKVSLSLSSLGRSEVAAAGRKGVGAILTVSVTRGKTVTSKVLLEA
jgi:hypothetical protein